MRLYTGKIPAIADEIVSILTKDGDIECDNPTEVRLDIESVLKEYLRAERSLTDDAKSHMETMGIGYGQLGKVKSRMAKERHMATGDDTLPFLVNQILQMLFHSQNVDEIYAEDVTLRTKMVPILRKHMDVDAELERQVRSQIKNLEEGTATFEVEYAKVMEQMKRKRGLSDT